MFIWNIYSVFKHNGNGQLRNSCVSALYTDLGGARKEPPLNEVLLVFPTFCVALGTIAGISRRVPYADR